MTIAYTSDLHADFFNKNISAPLKTRKFVDKYVLKGEKPDVLILAGDISHYNAQIYDICSYINELGITVLITTGNHEFYNVSKSQKHKYTSLYSRVNELKEMLTPLTDTHFLDGNCVTIDGVKFGGTMGWYDGNYYYKIVNAMYCENMESHWKKYSNDANLIPKLDSPYTLFSDEIEKVKSVLAEEPDIMITHVCPIAEAIAMDNKYRIDKGSGYYTFDGEELIDPYFNKKPPKYWVHGHMHDTHEFITYNTTHLRNPLGYKDEKKEEFNLRYIKQD